MPQDFSPSYLRKLRQRGDVSQIAQVGHELLARGLRDRKSLGLLARTFGEIGDEAGERAALQALSKQGTLSPLKQGRLVRLQLAGGDVHAAVETTKRWIKQALPDTPFEKVLGLIEARGTTAETLPLRELICDRDDDSAANRLLIVAELCRQGRRVEAIRHLRFATAMPVASTRQIEAIARWLTRLNLHEDALAFSHRLRREGTEPAIASRIELEALFKLGKADEAIPLALELVQNPAGSLSMYWAARVLLKSKVYRQEAAAAARHTVELGDRSLSALKIFATAEASVGNYEAPIAKLREAINADPVPDLLAALIKCLLGAGDVDVAVTTARGWLAQPELTAHKATLLTLMGTALRYSSQLDEAQIVLEEAVALASTDGKADVLLADLFELLGRPAEALCVLERHARMSGARKDMAGRLFFLNLVQRRMKEAYLSLAKRRRRIGFNELWPQSDPQERSVSGARVLFVTEAGLADEIQQLSCLGDLVADAGQVLVACEPRLVPILERSFPGIRTHGLNRFGANLRWDLPSVLSFLDDHVVDLIKRTDATLVGMDLFSRYRPTIASFRRKSAFIQPEPARRDRWRGRLRRLGDRPKVGICWRSMVLDYRRNEFCTKLSDWAPVFKIKDVAFVNLQYGADPGELEAVRAILGQAFISWDGLDLKNDLEDVFALTSELDLLVGAPTAALDFAGAVGTPALLLIPRPIHSLDWRLDDWTTGADILYASMRQVRPEVPLDYDSLMRKAAKMIETRFGLS